MANQPLEFRDERLRRVHEGLLLIGPGPAAFFRDGCRLMASEQPLESVSHIIAHLLREIEGAVLDVLYALSRGLPGSSPRVDPAEGSCNSRLGHTVKVNAALAVVGLEPEDPIAEAWRRLPDQINLAGQAHRRGLREPRPPATDLEGSWQTVVTILEVLLDRFQARYLSAVALVDRLLQIPRPSTADARTLRDHAPHNASLLAYFFRKCGNPLWLRPLVEAGFFEDPPTAGAWAFWPPSEYLARVGSVVPDEVTAIVEALPNKVSETVIEDVARALRTIPVPAAATQAGKVSTWLEGVQHLESGEEVSGLIAYLAGGSEIHAALIVAAALFDVVAAPDDRQSAARQAGLAGAEPSTRLEEWAFRERFKGLLPCLGVSWGMDFLGILSGALQRCIELEYGERTEGPADMSWLWRPAIEDHGQNLPFGTGSLLVWAVRTVAERILEKERRSLTDVIRVFTGHRWNVFTRLTLHVIRIAEARDSDLLARFLADHQLFDNPGVEHEYALLLGSAFPNLSANVQQKVLGWIEAGHQDDDFRQYMKREFDRSPTDEEVTRERKRWQLRKLAWIDVGLPENWRDYKVATEKEIGPIDHPTFRSWHESFIGPTSPKSADDMTELDPQELVTVLREWHPTGEHWSPTSQGLGRALSSVAKNRAQELSSAAGLFVGLDPTYLSGFFGGLRDAAKDGTAINWSMVLDLALWAVSQAREIPGRDPHGFDQDPHWGWCRHRIGDLLQQGFRPGVAELPFEQRGKAWAILEQIVRDPDPSPADELGKTDGFATQAINSTRGVALAAVCHYALWVRRHLENLPDSEERLAHGFEEMPEVRKVLDNHLDPQKDPSLAIRAVYGQYFPWLHLLDPAWAERNARAIFPADPDARPRWKAAWATYVTFSAPYGDLLAVLLPQYHLAIERVGETEDGDMIGHPDVELGEHLLAFYCRGLIEIDTEDGLITHFFQMTPMDLRCSVLDRVGWSLDRQSPPVAAEVKLRLVRLWEWRVETGASGTELAGFGSWFASGVFDEGWSLRQLENVLSLAASVKAEHFVARRLAEMARAWPAECLRCMERLVGHKEPFRICASREDIQAVVASARSSAIEGLPSQAAEFVNRLASKGLLDLRELLADEPEGCS